jgi:predicted SnoaL-like aldol condensation-catalyzing enzyme
MTETVHELVPAVCAFRLGWLPDEPQYWTVRTSPVICCRAAETSTKREHPVIRFFSRRAATRMAGAALVVAGSATLARASETQAEINKKSVLEFCDKAFNQKDFEAAKGYFGPQFIDHNPAASGDGTKDIEGIGRFLGFLRSKFPQSRFDVKRVFAEGDYVIVHAHGVREPGTRGRAVVDIFRLDQGKIVEHWDVVQEIPETTPNAHPFF